MPNNPIAQAKQKACMKLVEQDYFLKDAYALPEVSRLWLMHINRAQSPAGFLGVAMLFLL